MEVKPNLSGKCFFWKWAVDRNLTCKDAPYFIKMFEFFKTIWFFSHYALSTYYTFPWEGVFCRLSQHSVNIAWGRQESPAPRGSCAVPAGDVVGGTQSIQASGCCAMAGKGLFWCFSESPAKPKPCPPLESSHCESNKCVMCPAQLTVKLLSAKTPVILCSKILRYLSSRDHVLEMLVHPIGCCDTSHPSLPRWRNRNGVCLEVTLKSTCMLWTGCLEEGKKQTWRFGLLLISALLSTGFMPLPRARRNCPASCRLGLAVKLQ